MKNLIGQRYNNEGVQGTQRSVDRNNFVLKYAYIFVSVKHNKKKKGGYQDVLTLSQGSGGLRLFRARGMKGHIKLELFLSRRDCRGTGEDISGTGGKSGGKC